MPDVAFVFFEPCSHFIHLLLRDHSFIVEHSRVLLQVFQRRVFARSLAFRRYVIEYVFLARHIKERSLIRVAFTLLVRRCFRKTIRRILNIENDRLTADFLPPEFLDPFCLEANKVFGRVRKKSRVKLFDNVAFVRTLLADEIENRRENGFVNRRIQHGFA